MKIFDGVKLLEREIFSVSVKLLERAKLIDFENCVDFEKREERVKKAVENLFDDVNLTD